MNSIQKLREELAPYFLSFDGTRDLGRGTAFPVTGDLPDGLLAGDRFFRTDLGRLYYYDGAAWAPLNAPHRARVQRTSAQSLANATATAISFASTRYNVGTLWSAGAPTRLTAAQAGVYLITGHVIYAANATGIRTTTIRANAGADLAGLSNMAVTNGDGTQHSISCVYELAAADYVELVCYQTSGGALDVLDYQASSPEFSMMQVALT
jgi:hypothetical protein